MGHNKKRDPNIFTCTDCTECLSEINNIFWIRTSMSMSIEFWVLSIEHWVLNIYIHYFSGTFGIYSPSVVIYPADITLNIDMNAEKRKVKVTKSPFVKMVLTWCCGRSWGRSRGWGWRGAERAIARGGIVIPGESQAFLLTALPKGFLKTKMPSFI